jgi:spore maturation protein CgeB
LVPLWDGFQLHSLYAPIKEGEALAEQFLGTVTDFDKPLLVLGMGFGYHILPLFDKFPKIYIAESCQELINVAHDIPELAQFFEKCVILNNLEKLPPVPEYNLYILRSELKFQEKFFNDIQARLKIGDKNEGVFFEQMRILVNSPIYGGSYTTAKYVVSALESLGACVRLSDHSCAAGLLEKLLSPLGRGAGVVSGRGAGVIKDNNNLINQLTDLLSNTLYNDILAFRPHIVFFVAQSPFNDDLIKALNQTGIVTMYWFVEDFRRFPYWKSVCNNFDYFFMIQKGEFEEMLNQGCNKTYGWFPMAAEPQTHKVMSATKHDRDFYGSDISFMGAAYPNRVKFFKHFNKDKLKLWGTGWTESELADYHIPLKEERISPEQSNLIYQCSKININLHSTNDGSIFDPAGDFVNPRTFEIAACGGFQLVDDRPAVRELFDEDVDIVLFKSVEEAADKAAFYLKNEALRQKIANAGREKVLQHHTYANRLKNMLNTAIKLSPKLTANIMSENAKLESFMGAFRDAEFETFIKSFAPGNRFLYDKIIGEIYERGGNLKNYEALLMLLDTFYIGD